MESSAYLRNIINNLKGKRFNTLSELAEKAGVNQGNLSSFMNEGLETKSPDKKRPRSNMQFETVWKILNYLGVSLPNPENFPTICAPGKCPMPITGDNLKTINVYDVAGAGPAVAIAEVEPLFSVTAPPEYFYKSDYALKVSGHSMEPLIPHNAIVGIKLGAEFLANELYAARIPYEGLVIKRVGVDRENNKFVFKSENKDKENYPPFSLDIAEAEEIIVGRVVWVMMGY